MEKLPETANKIFRYKMSEDILLLITQFAKIHQYDDRHTYKEAWENNWLIEHRDMVEREISRLQQLGYKGDVIDKMFKAGRYYFREKKSTPNVNDTEKKQRNYINMDSEVIQSMDAHLLTIMNEPNFKPAIGYDLFCAQHIDILRNEIMRLIKENPAIKDTPEKLSSKIKKTYKNRYFILSQQED